MATTTDTTTVQQLGNDWHCDEEELKQELSQYEHEAGLEHWTEGEIRHFLSLKFHLLRGKPTKEHIEQVKALVITEEEKDEKGKLPFPQTADEEVLQLKARELVNSPEQLLDTVNEIMRIKVVGEDNNKKTLWLLLYGGEHIYVVGPSSAGKSHLIKNSLSVIPDEWVLERGSMSDEVMKYIDWEGKRVFYLQEFVSVSDEQDKKFRLTSCDDGGMEFSVSVRDPETGQWAEQHDKIPELGFVTSTTKLELNEENMTRSWMLQPTITEKQTREIVRRDNELAACPWARPNVEEDVLVVQRALKMLDPQDWKDPKTTGYRVAQPFLQLVDFSTKEVRIRRDRAKIERLSAIITIVFQKMRSSIQVNGQSYLIGSLSDLMRAISLTEDIFVATVTGLEQRHLEVLQVVAVKWADAKDHPDLEFEPMTAREISEHLDISQKQTYKVCKALVDKGFFYEGQGDGRGNPKVYSIKQLPSTILDVDWSSAEEHWEEWIETRLPEDQVDRVQEYKPIMVKPYESESDSQKKARKLAKAIEEERKKKAQEDKEAKEEEKEEGQTALEVEQKELPEAQRLWNKVNFVTGYGSKQVKARFNDLNTALQKLLKSWAGHGLDLDEPLKPEDKDLEILADATEKDYVREKVESETWLLTKKAKDQLRSVAP